MAFAVVFPGQGSQSVGMLADLASEHNEIKTTFAEASDIFGQDLWNLAQYGPKEVIGNTRITQPLMFCAAVAIWRVLRAQGMDRPVAVAGHSLGEFAAMVAADILTFSDAIALVAKRALLMDSAVPEGEGAMAAVLGMEDQIVVDLCASISGERISEAVNFNSPGQIAISGHLDAIEKTLAAAREQGCRRAIMLDVSAPNHCSLMKPVGVQLAKLIDGITFSNPRVPIVQNATATAPADLSTLLSQLKSHVFSPVYWTKSIQTLRDTYEASVIIEAGPGKVLTGLSKRIDRTLPTLPVDSPETLAKALEAISAKQELCS